MRNFGLLIVSMAVLAACGSRCDVVVLESCSPNGQYCAQVANNGDCGLSLNRAETYVRMKRRDGKASNVFEIVGQPKIELKWDDRGELYIVYVIHNEDTELVLKQEGAFDARVLVHYRRTTIGQPTPTLH